MPAMQADLYYSPAGMAYEAHRPAEVRGAGRPELVLPAHLPAACFVTAATDYNVPAEVLVAMIKQESRGKPVVRSNKDGSIDYGYAQINSASWVPYMERKYSIPREALVSSPCQAIRVQAYVLRVEQNHKRCAQRDIWCGVGRYHAPNNESAAATYVAKVRAELARMLRTGRFDS